jgi:hypothetical protein
MWKNNNLSIVVGLLFLLCLFGHSIAGWKEHNEDLKEHGRTEISYRHFLGSAEFGESVFENWESEFFQMAMYVFLTVFLFQRGSSESKKHDVTDEVEADPLEHRDDPDAPWPVRRGGLALRLYKNSLSLAFAMLFLLSFVLHGYAGAARHNEQERQHGKSEQLTTGQYMKTAQFWYESLQNWQSEFLAVLSIVVLSIHFRQWGSPESKPVHAKHSDTGNG